ncbi:MAG: YeaH/YhbH family protein [Gammaproteobacteria bacterium]|nr:YeaH/YhbH family protein [Gammaproteobacteria bacterium]NNF61870.1 YeaH/YhbH family protein [Gammaproteobacteria bacterium]NNM19662.1 YeaH/YhbH family protein [Gammaproteobacteria bacterium]
MTHVVDRRLDGRNKSAANRQRFLRRFKKQLKQAVADASAKRSITDMDRGEQITIPADDISEPIFSHGRGGSRENIHPGNKEFIQGDRVARPQGGGGSGGDGEASDSGEGEDEFVFELSRDEFLDLLFEDLELPNLVKRQLARDPEFKRVRAGYTSDGMPCNINVVRSLQQSLARRIALTAGPTARLRQAERELEAKLVIAGEDSEDEDTATLRAEVDTLKRRIRAVPFIDTYDLRYNHRIQQPQPSTQAVMFCLMDVSGSMDQERKDLAKRFFTLLYLFLQRNYERIDVVFVRHHTVAYEVDEEEFFYARETGGTVVSSALHLMHDIVRERYPSSQWNIYAAQASDGDNWRDDCRGCRNLLVSDLMPLVQYFSYVEIKPLRHQLLWHEYQKIADAFPNFAMQQIDGAGDIYPVFRELFKRVES